MGDMKAWKADCPVGRRGESRPPVKPMGRRSGGESSALGGDGTRLLSDPVQQRIIILSDLSTRLAAKEVGCSALVKFG